MNEQIHFARENGYVQTVLGRRRYLNGINASNAIVRGAAERNAINSPIQGTAADMIKLAMIKIDAEFKLIVEDLTEKEKALLSRQAASTAHLLKAPDRIDKVVADIADHFLTKVAPNGLKAQLPVSNRLWFALCPNAFHRIQNKHSHF